MNRKPLQEPCRWRCFGGFYIGYTSQSRAQKSYNTIIYSWWRWFFSFFSMVGSLSYQRVSWQISRDYHAVSLSMLWSTQIGRCDIIMLFVSGSYRYVTIVYLFSVRAFSLQLASLLLSYKKDLSDSCRRMCVRDSVIQAWFHTRRVD